MDATDINNGEALPLPEHHSPHEQPSVSEQLQMLNLYLYLDARRFGTSI